MNEKLKELYGKSKDFFDGMVQKVNTVNNDINWSAEGKQQQLQNLSTEARGRMTVFKELMQNEVKYTINSVAALTKFKSLGQETELRLSNVLKLIELNGNGMTPNELTALIEPFNGDLAITNVLLKAIRSIRSDVVANGSAQDIAIPNYIHLVPEYIQALNRFNETLDAAYALDPTTGHIGMELIGVGYALDHWDTKYAALEPFIK